MMGKNKPEDILDILSFSPNEASVSTDVTKYAAGDGGIKELDPCLTHSSSPGPSLWDWVFMKYWKYMSHGIAHPQIDPRPSLPPWWPFDTRFDWRNRPEYGLVSGVITDERLRYFASFPKRPFKDETVKCKKVHDKSLSRAPGMQFCTCPANTFIDLACSFPTIRCAEVPPLWIRLISCATKIDVDWIHVMYAFHVHFPVRLYAAYLDYKVNFEHERTLRAYNEPWSIILPALRKREGRRVSWNAYRRYYHEGFMYFLWYCVKLIAKLLIPIFAFLLLTTIILS